MSHERPWKSKDHSEQQSMSFAKPSTLRCMGCGCATVAASLHFPAKPGSPLHQRVSSIFRALPNRPFSSLAAKTAGSRCALGSNRTHLDISYLTPTFSSTSVYRQNVEPPTFSSLAAKTAESRSYFLLQQNPHRHIVPCPAFYDHQHISSNFRTSATPTFSSLTAKTAADYESLSVPRRDLRSHQRMRERSEWRYGDAFALSRQRRLDLDGGFGTAGGGCMYRYCFRRQRVSPRSSDVDRRVYAPRMAERIVINLADLFIDTAGEEVGSASLHV